MTADRALHARALAAATSLTRPCTHRPEEPAMTDNTTDSTTQRMKDETGHDCPACPSDVRNLAAVLHNLVGAIEAAGRGVGDWSRVHRKAAEARRALDTWEPTRAAHFEALNDWRRP